MIIWGDKVVNSEARQILEAVKAGSMSIDDALLEIKKEPFEDIGICKGGFTQKNPPRRSRSNLWCRKNTRADDWKLYLLC